MKIRSGLLMIATLVACQATGHGQDDHIFFKRAHEPREKAFSLLVPDGWIVDGGAVRFLADRIAGAGNMVDCKFDMAVKSGPDGKIMIRWLPEILCVDQAFAFGNPEGAIFNNLLVRRKRTPDRLISEVAIPYAHPQAADVKIVSGKMLPALAQFFQGQVDPAVRAVTNMSYQAGMLEYTYSENGTRYQERMVTVIEDYGANGAGMWKNRSTLLVRAPQGELNRWEPVLAVILNSGIWRAGWVGEEINNQRRRAGQILVTQKEIEDIAKSINDNHQKTNAEINKDMYLTLTGQNEYKNPHTGETETDSNNWKYRWINNLGEIVYTDRQNYDPNLDVELNKRGFKLSVPRK